MPYYHYTNDIESITSSGTLYAGHNNVFGKGVYFTSMAPSKGKKKVARNNWDGIWEIALDLGKMGGVIKIYNVNHNDNFKQVGRVDDRDIILYCRDQLDLSNFKWAAFTIDWNGNFLRKLHPFGNGSNDDSADSSNES
jgi:hypothetical protein